MERKISFIDNQAETIRNNIKNSNISLLVLLVIFLFILPFMPAPVYKVLFEVFYLAIFIIASISTGKYFKKILAWTVTLLFIEIVSLIFKLPYLLLLSRAASFAFLILITLLIIINIARSGKVNLLVLLEAVNAYLLLGIAFSFIVMFIMLISPDAFNVGIIVNDKIQFIDITYYTFTTMTTLGYGDLLPVTRYAKSTSIFITITGQIYLTVMIGMLIGKIANENKNN